MGNTSKEEGTSASEVSTAENAMPEEEHQSQDAASAAASHAEAKDGEAEDGDVSIQSLPKKAVQYGETELVESDGRVKASRSLSMINDSTETTENSDSFSALSKFFSKSLGDVRRRTAGSQTFKKSPYVLEIQEFSSKRVSVFCVVPDMTMDIQGAFNGGVRAAGTSREKDGDDLNEPLFICISHVHRTNSCQSLAFSDAKAAVERRMAQIGGARFKRLCGSEKDVGEGEIDTIEDGWIKPRTSSSCYSTDHHFKHDERQGR
eukprot:768085-Hanusia_phi.AAC.1